MTAAQSAVVFGKVREPDGRSQRRRAMLAWSWLALMTLVAAVLRFWALDRPTIWGDEAAVYWRTCGTFQQMLAILRNDGFAPLHYELYWVLQQFFRMTPEVMRFVPALAAVLMVPVMYWLAQQLTNTRVALVVATFTAVSAHLGWHAHDAKMYMHFWLMCTLNMACLLWWLRAGGGTAWWCWVASGVAMVGLHSTGFAVLALQPLFVLIGPRRNWRMLGAYLLGVSLIGVGPAIYYLNFNVWARNIESGGWVASGIAWVEQLTANATVGQLSRGSVTHLLMGYDFPSPFVHEMGVPVRWHIVQQLPLWIGVAVLVALFPWPTRDRGRGVRRPDWWRSALIIGAWALLPPYAFYCASFKDCAWPVEIAGDLVRWLVATLGVIRSVLVGLAAFYFLAPSWRGRVRLVAQGAAVVAVLLLLASAIAWALSVRPPGPVWITRYMGFIWPALVIGMFALLLRVPLWPVRWLVVGLLIALTLGQSLARLNLRQDAPLDLVAADVLEAREPVNRTQTHFLVVNMTQTMQAIERRYYLFMMSGEQASPEEFRSGSLRRFGLSTTSTAQTVARTLRESVATRLITWEQVPGPRASGPPREYADRMARTLPQGWQRVSEDVYPFTGRWGGWVPATAWRRCEYHLTPAH